MSIASERDKMLNHQKQSQLQKFSQPYEHVLENSEKKYARQWILTNQETFTFISSRLHYSTVVDTLVKDRPSSQCFKKESIHSTCKSVDDG